MVFVALNCWHFMNHCVLPGTGEESESDNAFQELEANAPKKE